MPKSPRKKPGILKQLVFMLIVVCIFFGGFELLLRVVGFSFNAGVYAPIEGEVTEYHWSTRGLIRDPEIPWSWIPEPGKLATQPARHDFTYNKDGFRGPEVPLKKKRGTIRIICMGDSCTLGWDAPDGGTYPDLLRTNLNILTTGGFEVINAGVSGYSSHQGIIDLKRRLMDWQPDIVVASYNWNDHGDAPDRVYGPAVYLPRERRQYPDNEMPGSSFGFKLKQGLSDVRIGQLITRLVWKVKGHEMAEPVLEIKEDGSVKQQQSIFPPGTGLRRVEPEDFRLNLWEIRKVCKQHGVQLIFLTQAANPVQHRDVDPWKTYYKYQDQYNDLIRQVAKNSETPLVDVAAADWWSEEHFYDHVHKRPEANQKIADAVMKEVILATPQIQR